ncbi:hypothetical protein Tco_1020718, partial [Tanacetum coccineum]
KENGVNILKSINEGPFQMGTFQETLAKGNEGALHLGPERARVYSDLSPEDMERYIADIRAKNILLQGFPKDIYTLINHYTDAKDIWDNVKMLLEGSELTKEDRESQLYDDFEHFRQNKEETIHDYYVRFVTAVKLNRGLRDSNYDQLYANLKQHKAHANENKMMLEHFTQPNVDPLALISNASHQQTSSNTRNQATVQDGRVVVQNVHGCQNRGQANNARGEGAASYEGAQNRVGNANPGQARLIKCYNCNAQENGVALDEEQLLFIVGGQDNAIDEDVDEQPVQDLALNVDNTMFMAKLSSVDPIYDEAGPSYDSDILSEVHDRDYYQDTVCENHEAHEMHHDVQPNCVVDLNTNYTSDSNMITYDQYVKDNAKPVVQSSYQLLELQPALYNGHEIIKTNHVPAIVHNSEDTLEIAETTRKLMNEKMKDPECVKKKVKIAPHDYSKENYLATFTPQKQFTPEQIFWTKDLITMKAEALKEQTIASRLWKTRRGVE